MKSKKIILFSSFIVILFLMIFSINKSFAKNISIDEVLNGKEYSNLSQVVKDFIKDYYEENHVLLVTKEIAKDGEPYLNPSYINYLESKNKKKYNIIPSIISYKPSIRRTRGVLPSKFDLRNVNGMNYVTPNKNQGNEGLCWAYSTMSLLETHDLIAKNNTYDDNALLLSEKQLDYALSNNGILGGNYIASYQRELSY
jgi:C1A family cysteine protease